MALDSSGNVYVTGQDGDSPPGFVTLKINSSGQIVWVIRYSGGMAIKATPKSIAVDLYGNVYVGASDVDYLVIKYDSSGVEQWVRRFRGSGGGINSLNDLATEDISMSIIHTGYATFNSGFSGCFTNRSNYSNGDSVWSRRYTPNPTICGRIVIDIFKNINVSGISNIAVLAPDDLLTLSYDINGNLRWAQTWNGPGNRRDVAADIASDKNGNVYVTGYATMDSTFDEDIVTIKYDSEGNQEWVRFYDGDPSLPSNAQGYFVKTDLLGNVIVAGGEKGKGTSVDFCTIKYDSLGNQLWHRTYNGPANQSDYIEGVAVDKYGSTYITGTANETTNLYKIYTIKYDKDGNQVWLEKYPAYDTVSAPKAIIVDKNLNVYIAGEIGVAGYNNDIIVLKYSQLTSVEQIKDKVPDGYKLYQNYPNPFNSITNIKYQITNSSYVIIKVYEIFGREVATLVDEKKEPGEHQVEWDAGGLASGVSSKGARQPSVGLGYASGVYYYRMISGKNIETKKALFLK
jgi:hypothetical protein